MSLLFQTHIQRDTCYPFVCHPLIEDFYCCIRVWGRDGNHDLVLSRSSVDIYSLLIGQVAVVYFSTPLSLVETKKRFLVIKPGRECLSEFIAHHSHHSFQKEMQFSVLSLQSPQR